MAEFPLDPQLPKALLLLPKYNCINEVLSIVSLLSVPPLFYRPSQHRQEADICKNKFSHINDNNNQSIWTKYNVHKQFRC